MLRTIKAVIAVSDNLYPNIALRNWLNLVHIKCYRDFFTETHALFSRNVYVLKITHVCLFICSCRWSTTFIVLYF